ncbi:MogA/MoaB family molybdenum cofactor biosynthesis protein [Spirulina subsalsa]|uniref:MogA/MoaB family molybdenum cofactor biosynthesis protein n=1 Tax=Spirulina subsalsa TaxID=54311 RepID=UPI000316424D|nr:MogA/MoaB family molybdenum cofactor biosynthesis protein [Spirulina subsalsa]
MILTPHPDSDPKALSCAVITVSDTRTVETDRSGALMRRLLSEAGHQIVFYQVLRDEPQMIQAQLMDWGKNSQLQVILLNGGTGIAPRDRTYDAIVPLLEKTLPGFGELFRLLSFQEIGSRAMASRAIAGIYQNKLIFSVPGSTNAVQLAMERLILPELNHLESVISQS